MSTSVKITLRTPVQLGKDAEPITELELKPISRAFRDFPGLPMREDGTIIYQPQVLCAVGLKMAGQSPVFLDHMNPADMAEVARIVMGFLMPGQPIGANPSP